jgi:hypothetical protein
MSSTPEIVKEENNNEIYHKKKRRKRTKSEMKEVKSDFEKERRYRLRENFNTLKYVLALDSKTSMEQTVREAAIRIMELECELKIAISSIPDPSQEIRTVE